MEAIEFDDERADFRRWMETQEDPLSKNTIDSRIANCKWIENHLSMSGLPYATLPEAYEDDGLFDVFQFLMYSSDHKLGPEIKGNLKNNLSTYRSSLVLYMEFKQGLRHDKQAKTRYEAAANITHDKSDDVLKDLFVDDAKVEIGNGEIAALWKEYRAIRTKITEALGRTSNIEAEISELATAVLHNGSLFPKSYKAADVITSDGKSIQVKSRVLRQGKGSKLSAFRSWDFDILAIVVFAESGDVIAAYEMEVDVAREYTSNDGHVNGEAITISEALKNDARVKDRTQDYQEVISSL